LAKIEVILCLPPVKTKRKVQGFLGHVSDYQIFIENFSRIVMPLSQLLVKEVFHTENSSYVAKVESD